MPRKNPNSSADGGAGEALPLLALAKLEASIQYAFRERDHLIRALTHKSRAVAMRPVAVRVGADIEQLEFLGDAVLGFLVTEWLLLTLPHLSEGQLSKRKAHLVSADHLYEVALRLRLGEYLLLGRGEELNGARQRKALLADVVEAVLAAIYLDGGIEQARRFVLDVVLAGISPADDREPPVTDYKTALQERAQALHLPAPRYQVVRESGPEHARRFTVEARMGALSSGEAESTTKKGAEQKAARALLERLALPLALE